MTNEYDVKDAQAGEELIKKFGDMVNGGDAALVEGMLYAFVREHRTLQQSMVRGFVRMMTRWAEEIEKDGEAYFVDARNQDACKFARKLKADNPGFWLI
jgi:hypothetical protein